MKPLKNKSIGAKVIVDQVLVSITPRNGCKYLKKVPGVLVEDEDAEDHIYVVKLDDGITDMVGNNVIWCEYSELTFVQTQITEAQYNQALKVIQQYEHEQTLL